MGYWKKGVSGGVTGFLLIASSGMAAEVSSEYLYWTQKPEIRNAVTCDTGTAPLNRYGEATLRLCDSGSNWLQRLWIEQGLAIYNGSGVIPDEWITSFQEAEAIARSNKAGLWQSDLTVQNANDDNWIGPLEGFWIAEGRVQSVLKSKGTLYLNFGPDWKTDFTVAISSQSLPKFRSESWNFDALVNMSIRVRGYVRHYNGPYMEIDWPTQIEKLPQP